MIMNSTGVLTNTNVNILEFSHTLFCFWFLNLSLMHLMWVDSNTFSVAPNSIFKLFNRVWNVTPSQSVSDYYYISFDLPFITFDEIYLTMPLLIILITGCKTLNFQSCYQRSFQPIALYIQRI